MSQELKLLDLEGDGEGEGGKVWGTGRLEFRFIFRFPLVANDLYRYLDSPSPVFGVASRGAAVVRGAVFSK